MKPQKRIITIMQIAEYRNSPAATPIAILVIPGV